MRQYLCGMLGFCSQVNARISVFFVMKKILESGKWSLRPVWDLRAVNFFFKEPPELGLGPPAAMSELDLLAGVTEGRRLGSAWGDVPDFFHRCQTTPELYPYIVLVQVTPQEVCRALRKHGYGAPRLRPGNLHCCLVVRLMGLDVGSCIVPWCSGGHIDRPRLWLRQGGPVYLWQVHTICFDGVTHLLDLHGWLGRNEASPDRGRGLVDRSRASSQRGLRDPSRGRARLAQGWR